MAPFVLTTRVLLFCRAGTGVHVGHAHSHGDDADGHAHAHGNNLNMVGAPKLPEKPYSSFRTESDKQIGYSYIGRLLLLTVLIGLQVAVLLHTLGDVFTAIAVTATAILIKAKGRSHTSGSCRSVQAIWRTP